MAVEPAEQFERGAILNVDLRELGKLSQGERGAFAIERVMAPHHRARRRMTQVQVLDGRVRFGIDQKRDKDIDVCIKQGAVA